MGAYQITCTRQEPLGQPHEAAHIVQVGLANASVHPLQQVLAWMQAGHTFYTLSPRTEVSKYICGCGRVTIRSHADGHWRNNLDALPRCP